MAHRLSTIVDSNIIFVLEAGRIVEKGTHEELLINNEIYADVYNSQMKGNEEEYEIAK